MGDNKKGNAISSSEKQEDYQDSFSSSSEHEAEDEEYVDDEEEEEGNEEDADDEENEEDADDEGNEEDADDEEKEEDADDEEKEEDADDEENEEDADDEEEEEEDADDEEEEEEDADDEEEEEENEEDADDEDEEEENEEDADDEDEEGGNDSDDNHRTESDEDMCNRVISLIKEGCELDSLSLKQLKAYLRNNGLRITGTKAVCQHRILEHWRIKDGKAEALYPSSSFSINCTGDVCKGDVVLFNQKVYKKFDKMTRHGRLLGRRTIAGRVVKESYGKAKQQHTFTVEVLWSKGTEKLPPLYPLLVKGRNLYKLETYRQRWSDEAERRNVLAEKHKRGKAARLVKAMKGARKWSTDVGTKRRKHSHQSRPSKKRKATEAERGKCNARRKAPIPRCASRGNNYQVSSPVRQASNYQVSSPVRQVKKKQNSRFRVSSSSYSHGKSVHFAEAVGGIRHSYAGPPLNPYQPPRNIANYDIGSTSTMVRSLAFRPYIDPRTVPASQCQGFNRHYYTHHFCNR